MAIRGRYGAGGPAVIDRPAVQSAIPMPEKAEGAQERKRIEGFLQNIDGTFIIDLKNQLLTVKDIQATPETRVKLGKLGAGTTDYGIEIFDSSGATVFSVSGLGVNTVGNAQMKDNAIGTVELIALAVTEAKVADSAIATAKIADAAVATGKLALLAVTPAQLAALAVTEAKIADLAVTNGKIALLAVDTAQIAATAITTAKIGLLQVTGATIAASAITAGKIDANAVTTVKLNALAVTTAKLDALAVTAAKIAANTITAGQIFAGTITATEIATDAIIAAKILASAVTTVKLNALAVTAAKIAANTITAAQIAAGTITAAEIDALTITASEIAAGTITADKMNVSELSAIVANLGTITAGLIKSTSDRVIFDLANKILTVDDASAVRRLEIGEVSSGIFGIKAFNQDAELVFSMINGANAGLFILRAGIGDDVGAGATGVALKVGTQFTINGTRQIAMEGGFTAAANNDQNFVGLRSDMSFAKNAKTGLKIWQIFLTNFTVSGTGTLDVNTALEIADITGGTTNYAIKTNAGLVSFGDAVDFQGAVTGIALNEIENPESNKTFVMTTKQLKFLWTAPGGNPMELEASGAYSGALLHIHQHTGNPAAGTHLVTIEAEDTDVELLHAIAPATGTHVFELSVSGDANDRWRIEADGMQSWGPGDAAVDTNLYRSAANTLKTDDAFVCSALTATTVTATGAGDSSFVGKVGIGITNPTEDLHIKDTSAIIIFEDSASGINGQIGSGDGLVTGGGALDMAIRTQTGNNILFSIGSTEKMRLSSDGNLGIGAVSPTDELHIAGANPVIRLEDDAGTLGNLAIEIKDTDAYLGVSTTAGKIILETGHSSSGHPSTGTARLTINGSSGILIAAALEIDGDLNHDGSAIGFFGGGLGGKATVAGSRDGNAPLGTLLIFLENIGMITNNSTA